MTDSDHANNRRFANPWRYCSLVVFGRRQREAQARTIRQRDAVRAAMPGGTAALFLRRHQAAFAPGLAHSSIECMGQVRFSPCRGDLVHPLRRDRAGARTTITCDTDSDEEIEPAPGFAIECSICEHSEVSAAASCQSPFADARARSLTMHSSTFLACSQACVHDATTATCIDVAP